MYGTYECSAPPWIRNCTISVITQIWHINLPTTVHPAKPLAKTCTCVQYVSFQVAVAEFRRQHAFRIQSGLHVNPYSALTCASDLTLDRQWGLQVSTYWLRACSNGLFPATVLAALPLPPPLGAYGMPCAPSGTSLPSVVSKRHKVALATDTHYHYGRRAQLTTGDPVHSVYVVGTAVKPWSAQSFGCTL